MVEVGKCTECKMEVLDVGSSENRELLKRYDITAAPSIVIDGKIKVVGVPTFPWFCGDEFYRMLEREYSLNASFPTKAEPQSNSVGFAPERV